MPIREPKPSTHRRMPDDSSRVPPEVAAREELEELCVRAITVAAADLGLNPRAFAEELAQGEIGLLISYLRQAATQVEDLELRTHIDQLLHRLTFWTGRTDAGA